MFEDSEFEPFCIDEIEHAELMEEITEDIDEEIEEHLRKKKRIFRNN